MEPNQGRSPRGPTQDGSPSRPDHNDLRSPRISWSVLVMGIGVVVSIVLNYAAYDTRIAVLEKAAVVSEKQIAELKQGIKRLESQNGILSSQQSGSVIGIDANTKDIIRLEKTSNKMDDRLRYVEQGKGKP